MSKEASASSPDILFDVPSTSSPELSFSTPHAEPLHLDSIDLENRNSPTPEDQSKELEGLRTVNITPTGEEDRKNATETRTASPPLVLKSVPTTPIVRGFPSDEDESTSPSKTTINGLNQSYQERVEDEDDPRELVISSLRTQISDLFSQVSLLNSKLVQSYDRVSQLEETLDENTEKMSALEGERMNLEREKSVLEVEREKHGELVRTGKLVERSAVAAELNRLMEESLKSSDARKSAEAKHAQIESELSDLSANLFSTANEMVAKERKARAAVEDALSTSKAECKRLEDSLKTLEVRLAENGRSIEILKEERAVREGEVKELRQVVRTVDLVGVTTTSSGAMRMMNSHTPYKVEFLGFIAHLRKMLPTTPNPPLISSVLSLPFLQRLAVEDSEPTLRLDLAPSLNWLTRRSVLAAIHTNTLLVEQIHVATLFLENSATTYSYSPFSSGTVLPTSPTQLTKVVCALCGKVVYMSPEAIQAEQSQYQALILSQSPTTPTPTTHQHPQTSSPQRSNSGGGWAAAKFLKSVNLSSLSGTVTGGGSGSGSTTPISRNSLDVLPPSGLPESLLLDRPPSPPPPTSLQTVIHAFRVPGQGRSNSTTNNSLSTSDASAAENYGPPYPLCHTGWCLARLKTTCELWGFVGHDVLERVWKEARSIDLREMGDKSIGRRSSFDAALGGPGVDGKEDLGIPPPLPPKKKMPNLWGMGRDVFDKFGSPTSAGADSPSSVTPSNLFSGMRRTFSGPSVVSSNASTATLVARPRGSLDNEAIASMNKSASEGTRHDIKPPTVENKDQLPTVAAGTNPPPLPSRKADRLSAVFTGGSSAVVDTVKGSGEVDSVPADSSPQMPAEPSISSDAFVTPSETPAQGMSPMLEVEVESKNPEIAEEPEKTKEDNSLLKVEAKDAADAELLTPTPNTTQFSKSATTRIPHQRSASTTSVLSDVQGASTPRPSTPKRMSFGGSRPGTPSKLPTATSRPSTPNKGGAGSRPSTPSKSAPATATNNASSRPGTPNKAPGASGAPPPLPRRAAARNAARSGSGVISKKEIESILEEKTKDSITPAPAAEEGGVSAVEATESGDQTKTEDAAPKTSLEVPSESKPDSVPPEESSQPAPLSGMVVADTSVSAADTTITSSTVTEMTETSPPEKDIPTPKSIPMALPPPEVPSPSAHPLPTLPPLETDDPASGSRPRQPSVSNSSVYSQSVYSGLPGGQGERAEGGVSDEKGVHKDAKEMRFYVGRGTWEERAWLELVRIRESMFWARLGGVKH